MTRTAIIFAAAMLAGGIAAVAQTSSTTSTPSATVNQGKCWDTATKQIRSQTTTQMGSSTTTTSPSTTTGSGSSSSSSSSSSGRPAEAMNLPDCK